MARILVVSRSQLLGWMVAKVAPPGVEVYQATTISEAGKILAENPPDAAIFNIASCHIDWRKLLDQCTSNGRIVPFLCMAEVSHYEVCNCSLPCRVEDLMPKNLPRDQFRDKIAALVEESRQEDPPRFRHLRDPSSI